MFSDVYHICYLTDDLDAATTFYCQTFDAEVLLQTESPDTGSKMAYLQVGATQVELIEPADKARLKGQTGLVYDHIGYVVERIETTMEQLTALGISFATVAPKTSAEGARVIYLDSTSVLGARIHLTERPARGNE